MKTNLHKVIFLILGLFCFCLTTSRSEDARNKLINNVLTRIIKNINSAKDFSLPLKIEIINDTIIEAGTFKSYDSEKDIYSYKIILSLGLFSKIIKDDENILAFILSHEIAHILKNHLIENHKNKSKFKHKIITLGDEFDADFNGMKMALDAGFSYSEMLKGMKRMIDIGFFQSSAEYLSREHPSWSDRLSFLDNRQKELWRSISAFINGVSLLSLEQYDPALYCFNYVLDQFPGCYEAHVNIGYIKLMKYIETLDIGDLAELSIGCFITGGFYKYPNTLKILIRGIDRDLWWDAVGEFQFALKLKPDLTLAKANLGLAYLISPFTKKMLGRAEKFMSEAIDLAESDSTIDFATKAIIYLNAGLSYMMVGYKTDGVNLAFYKAKEYGRRFGEFSLNRDKFLGEEIENTICYNNAVALLSHDNQEDNDKAFQLFEKFLLSSDINSIWWKIAQKKYLELCKKLNLSPNPKFELSKSRNQAYKPILGIMTSDNTYFMLFENRDAFLSKINGHLYEEKSVLPDKNLKRIVIKDLGIELLASGFIFAIFLNQANSPQLIIDAKQNDVKKISLYVGMSVSELKNLTNNLIKKEKVYLINTNNYYTYFTDLGVAVKLNRAGNIVEEIVIVQIPN